MLAPLGAEVVQAFKSRLPNETLRSVASGVGFPPEIRIPSNRSTGFWILRSPGSSCCRKVSILERSSFARQSLSESLHAPCSCRAISTCSFMIEVAANHKRHLGCRRKFLHLASKGSVAKDFVLDSLLK